MCGARTLFCPWGGANDWLLHCFTLSSSSSSLSPSTSSTSSTSSSLWPSQDDYKMKMWKWIQLINYQTTWLSLAPTTFLMHLHTCTVYTLYLQKSAIKHFPNNNNRVNFGISSSPSKVVPIILNIFWFSIFYLKTPLSLYLEQTTERSQVISG